MKNYSLKYLSDYMFTCDNIAKYTKHIIQPNIIPIASNQNIIKSLCILSIILEL